MNTAYSKILEKLGIQSLNEMQEQVIDSVLNKSDIVLISPTGSGKTLAFLLPLIDLLDKRIADVQALILTPTRELALQTESVFKSLGTSFKIN
ncbi:MAG: DEAD/DEAH box helicase, partial [Bacteroidales bacterium]|nr:DEAD/DEAH box helicase [Bacteroidales bacterium]